MYYEGESILPLQQVESHASEPVPQRKVLSVFHMTHLATGFENVNLSDAIVQEGNLSDEEDMQESILKSSKLVKATNFPTTGSNALDKDKFVQYFNIKMQDANFVNKGEDCVVKCELNPMLQFAIVELRNCEEANLATLLEDVHYCGHNISIIKYAHDTDNNVIESALSEANSNLNVFDGEGALIYCRLLIKHRDSLPKCGSHDRILETIRVQLLHRGVRASLADLRVKRERLKELFRKKKVKGLSNHPFYVPGQVMFEGANLSLISGTSYDPSLLGDDPADSHTKGDKHGDNLLRFSKVASWTSRASKALIEKVIETQDEYYKPQRRTNYWSSISSMMVEDKYFYTASQCEARCEKLKCMYKDYKQEYERTGSQGPMFSEGEEPMRQIMRTVAVLLQGKVSVDPKYTVAAGVKVQEKHSDQSGSSVRVGKSRPNVMKRTLSLKERKYKVDKMRAKALLLISRKFAGEDNDYESENSD